MLSVPLVSLCIQVACVLAVAFVSSSFRLALRPLPLLGGLFWSALGCVLTAIIRSYRTRDFVVAMMLTP